MALKSRSLRNDKKIPNYKHLRLNFFIVMAFPKKNRIFGMIFLSAPYAPPEHLLGQNFPSKGKLGEFSLRGKIFPQRDPVCLKIAFPFPSNGLFSQEMKGLGRRDFYALREIFDFPSRGEIYLKPFFCLKRCFGPPPPKFLFYCRLAVSEIGYF